MASKTLLSRCAQLNSELVQASRERTESLRLLIASSRSQSQRRRYEETLAHTQVASEICFRYLGLLLAEWIPAGIADESCERALSSLETLLALLQASSRSNLVRALEALHRQIEGSVAATASEVSGLRESLDSLRSPLPATDPVLLELEALEAGIVSAATWAIGQVDSLLEPDGDPRLRPSTSSNRSQSHEDLRALVAASIRDTRVEMFGDGRPSPATARSHRFTPPLRWLGPQGP